MQPAEGFGIVAGAVESGGEGDFRDGQIRVLQKTQAFVHAVLIQIFVGRFGKILRKQFAAFALPHRAGCGDLRQRQPALVVFLNEADHVFDDRQIMALPVVGAAVRRRVVPQQGPDQGKRGERAHGGGALRPVLVQQGKLGEDFLLPRDAGIQRQERKAVIPEQGENKILLE